MKNRPPQEEYRFDLVPEGEWANCFNWELYRECSRRDGRRIQRPWLELGAKAKSNFRKSCGVDFFGKSEAVTMPPPPWYGAKACKGQDQPVSAEVVTLPPALVQWDSSDAQIIEGFKTTIRGWLDEQRRTNPNAR